MRKVLGLVLALVLIASSAYAIMVDRYVSADSVSFNTASRTEGVHTLDFAVSGQVVTFNTTVNKVLFINESSSETLYVAFTNLGYNYDNSPEYGMPTKGTSGETVLGPSSSISLDIATDKIGWINRDDYSEGTISYVVTSDVKQP